MNEAEGITRKLRQRYLVDSEITTLIIENPHCLDGNSQKEAVYRIAIYHYVEKQKASEVTTKDGDTGYIASKKLQDLINSYVNEHEASKQTEYARQIALYMLQKTENWLKLIPDGTKDVAFQIIFNYLEEQIDRS